MIKSSVECVYTINNGPNVPFTEIEAVILNKEKPEINISKNNENDPQTSNKKAIDSDNINSDK